MKQFFALIGLFAMSILVLGCSGSDDRVEVNGTVEVDGKPMVGVSVAFIGGGGGSISTASTAPDGKFKTKVKPGINVVTVSKQDDAAVLALPPPKEADMTMNTAEGSGTRPAAVPKGPKTLIASRFADPKASGLSFDIKSGMEPLFISVSAK
jgi:hypothetical protein